MLSLSGADASASTAGGSDSGGKVCHTLHPYTPSTPNSLKPVIGCERMGLSYEPQSVDLQQGKHRDDSSLVGNPSGRIPARVAGDGLSSSGSAAILVHLVQKSGQLLPTEATARAKEFKKLLFHTSGVSPAFRQSFLAATPGAPVGHLQGRETGRLNPAAGNAGHHSRRHEMNQTNEAAERIRELLDRNLQEVFEEGDAQRRRAAIDKFAGDLRATHPHFVYTPLGEPQVLQNAGRLAWGSGPQDQAPEYTGWDVIIVRDGRIAALYVFLDEAMAEFRPSVSSQS
jgi:glutathione S-transferase